MIIVLSFVFLLPTTKFHSTLQPPYVTKGSFTQVC
jgi:hypothetical protein